MLTRDAQGEAWWLAPKASPDNPRLWSPGIKAGRPLDALGSGQADGIAPGSFAHVTEFFGPVMSVLVADDLSEAIQWANATPYGLTAGLHSLDEAEPCAATSVASAHAPISALTVDLRQRVRVQPIASLSSARRRGLRACDAVVLRHL